MRLPMMPQAYPPPFAQARLARSGGFTLIEMMFAIVILAILITLGAPYLANLVREQRIKTAAFDVYAALVYARSEAIKRNASIDVRPASSDWAAGWSINAGGTRLRVQDPLPGTSIARQDGSAIGDVTYRGDGRLAASVPQIVVWSIENTSLKARCVTLDLSGRPNIKMDSNNSPTDGC